MASMPACAMGTGVSKSGSPAPRPMTSLPSALRRAARAVTASVGEGLARWTRRETDRGTGIPVVHRNGAGATILRDRGGPDHYGAVRRARARQSGMEQIPFKLEAGFEPAGDQPEAIAKLVEGLRDGLSAQTLLGVTGSGKTYVVSQVIERVQRPTLVLAHNKTLAAQLYGEFRSFFPHNSVEYFVSYYEYYQPEAYVPSSDTYIEKDASINEHIEQMRLSATKALIERRDALIVSTVSAIYGLGDPDDYLSLRLILSVGEKIDPRKLIRQLTELQYERGDYELRRGSYRVR